MTCCDVVRIVPVNHASGPFDSAWSGGVNACGPQTEFNHAGRVRELADAVCAVDGIVGIKGAYRVTVDQPRERGGRPVDLFKSGGEDVEMGLKEPVSLR